MKSRTATGQSDHQLGRPSAYSCLFDRQKWWSPAAIENGGLTGATQTTWTRMLTKTRHRLQGHRVHTLETLIYVPQHTLDSPRRIKSSSERSWLESGFWLWLELVMGTLSGSTCATGSPCWSWGGGTQLLRLEHHNYRNPTGTFCILGAVVWAGTDLKRKWDLETPELPKAAWLSTRHSGNSGRWFTNSTND